MGKHRVKPNYRGKYRTLAIHTCEPARQRARALAQTPAFAISQRARRKVEALFAQHTSGVARPAIEEPGIF